MSTPTRPAVEAPGPWAFPEPVTTRLDSGLTLLTFDLPGQLVLSARLGVPMPVRDEPAGRWGIGELLARTLDEGTEAHGADEMAELLERRGVALGAGAGEYGLVVDVDVPRRRFAEALELVGESLAGPAFGADEVARHVRMRLAEIAHERSRADSAAGVEFLRRYYAAGDRFAVPAAGDAEGVAAVTPEALRAHHGEFVRPGGATLAVAGDLSGLDVERVVAEALAPWAAAGGGPRDAAAGPPAVAPGAPRVVLLDRPGSVQSELYVGCAGPDRHVAGGWAPFPVLAMALGGAPQSRLDAVLREEKGYTYGLRCGFRPRTTGGLFVARGSVRGDVTADALRLTLDILEGARDGFTDTETREAADFLRQTAPGRYATADAVAAEAVTRCLDGTGPDHTTRVLREMGDLTGSDLGEAYRTHVAGDWTCVVVGDAARIADGLEGLGRGDVTVVRDVGDEA